MIVSPSAIGTAELSNRNLLSLMKPAKQHFDMPCCSPKNVNEARIESHMICKELSFSTNKLNVSISPSRASLNAIGIKFRATFLFQEKLAQIGNSGPIHFQDKILGLQNVV